MENFTFSLVLDRDPDPLIDALFAAGCDDALFGTIDGVGYGDFDREAESFEMAIASAIRDVQSTGLTVIRIEPDDLVTASEIADRLGRSRESVRLWISGERGKGTFPQPLTHFRDRNRLWRWVDVAEWTGIDQELGSFHFIAALNAALELQRALSRFQFDLNPIIEFAPTLAPLLDISAVPGQRISEQRVVDAEMPQSQLSILSVMEGASVHRTLRSNEGAGKSARLDGRHRNADGSIDRKRGNTLIRTLRAQYGQHIAAGLRDDQTLDDWRRANNDASLSQLLRFGNR